MMLLKSKLSLKNSPLNCQILYYQPNLNFPLYNIINKESISITLTLNKNNYSYPFSTSSDPISIIRNLFFSNKPLNSSVNQLKDKEVNLEPDYGALVKGLDNFSSVEQESFMKHLKEIHQDITSTINDSFKNKNIIALMESVPSSLLLEIAIENFVGSMSKIYIRLFIKIKVENFIILSVIYKTFIYNLKNSYYITIFIILF